jgi:hypothetical protein
MAKSKKIDENSFVFHFMDMLSAPIITHAQTWADCIPMRLIQAIRLERLIQGLKKEECAGDAECVAFIMTRTFESPMDHDWVEIYCHLCAKVAEYHWKHDFWNEIHAQRELTDYQNNYLLKPLRLWIYKKRREVVKDRMKAMPAAPEPMTVQDVLDNIKSNGKVQYGKDKLEAETAIRNHSKAV